jgi:aminobenzoyl-glutamate transport protein
MTLPSGAALRDPQTGASSARRRSWTALLFIITILFLFAGIAYGYGAKTITTATETSSSRRHQDVRRAGRVWSSCC